MGPVGVGGHVTGGARGGARGAFNGTFNGKLTSLHRSVVHGTGTPRAVASGVAWSQGRIYISGGMGEGVPGYVMITHGEIYRRAEGVPRGGETYIYIYISEQMAERSVVQNP